jgi:hypothetical protein
VYVFALKPEHSDRLVDLRSIFPKRWKVRPRRQRAAELFESSPGAGLDDLLITRISLTEEVNPPLHLTTEYLFPSDRDDPVYRALTNLPAVVTPEDVRPHFSIGHPMLPIPVYCYDDYPPMSVVTRTKVVIGYYADYLPEVKDGLDWIVTLPYTLWDPRTESFPPRTPFERAEEPVQEEGAAPTDLLSGTWPQGRSFIRTPLTHMVGAYVTEQGRQAYPVSRGLIVDVRSAQVDFATVTDLDPGRYFVVADGKVVRKGNHWVPSSQKVHGDWDFLQSLAQQIRSGSAKLYKVAPDQLQLYWVGADGSSWVTPYGEPFFAA